MASHSLPSVWPGFVKEEVENEQDQVLLQYLGVECIEVCRGLRVMCCVTVWSSPKCLNAVSRQEAAAEWGALVLFSKHAVESIPDPGGFANTEVGYCAQSKLMPLNSLTYHVTFDPKNAQRVDTYYGRSIKAFRRALSDPDSFKEHMTLYVGILLCSISAYARRTPLWNLGHCIAENQQMSRAIPFTIHMNGITSMFHQKVVLFV